VRLISPWRSLLARCVAFAVLGLPTAAALAEAVADAGPRLGDAQIVADLRIYLDKLAAQDRFSGAVLLAKGDQILFERAYGFANHAFNARNKLDTKFNLGSMGKMFTAVSILQLAQQGKLSLADTVLKLVPDYPDKEIAAKITVHELLTHTSGLGDFFNEKFFDSSRAQFRTTQSHVRLFAGNPLLFEPGASWSYSNEGFVVLGLIIEHVSGESYYDYVREHVFRPAGMTSTDNSSTDDDVPNLALGYTHIGDDDRPHLQAPRRTNVLMAPARGGSSGGGYSTVEDLLRFSRSLQTQRLLNKSYTDLEMTGKVRTPAPNEKYGYGMVEAQVNGVRIVGHSGGFPGVNSQLDMYPDLGYTVVVMANYDDAARPVVERLRLQLTGQRIPTPIRLSAEALGAFAGKYAPQPPCNSQSGEPCMPPIEIIADGSGLRLDDGRGGAGHRFLALSANEFFEESVPSVRLRFDRDDAARIVALSLTGIRMPVTATRLP